MFLEVLMIIHALVFGG